jgi:quinol monooxygenase YgiN
MNRTLKSDSAKAVKGAESEPSLPDAIAARIKAVPGLADGPIVFFVSIKAKADNGPRLSEHLDYLARRAVAGGGATAFAIHRDAEDADRFLAEEHWLSLDAWLAYVNGPDVAETAPKVGPMMAEPFHFTFVRG